MTENETRLLEAIERYATKASYWRGRVGNIVDHLLDLPRYIHMAPEERPNVDSVFTMSQPYLASVNANFFGAEIEMVTYRLGGIRVCVLRNTSTREAAAIEQPSSPRDTETCIDLDRSEVAREKGIK